MAAHSPLPPPDLGGARGEPVAGAIEPHALPAAESRPAQTIRDGCLETVTLSDFRIHAKIGTGTQGSVFRAHQISRNRPVALKVCAGGAARRPNPAARFAREAALLARLDHPGIVRCLGTGGDHGFDYFAMEFVEGGNATWLQRVGGRPHPADALHIALRCADALGHASARHVIHRDIKPGNILIGRNGDVKLTDWGLAKPTDESAALTGACICMGTLRYVAPEQIRDARRADPRSDIYALGGVLYELLTGRVPFPGGDWLEVLGDKEKNALVPASEVNPAVPRGFDPVLARMLAPDSANRYPNYEQLIEALNGAGPVSTRLDLPPLAAAPALGLGRRLQILLVHDEADYVPLVQHALHAAGVPHDLTTVEDGHQAPASIIRDRLLGASSRPDVLIVGLTSPTQASAQLLTKARGRAVPSTLPVYGLSRSPDGVALLRALGLGLVTWVTGFDDLKPLGEALRIIHADAKP